MKACTPHMYEYNPSSWWGQCYGLGMFSWHDLGPLIHVEQRLNSTTYLSIVADQVHPIMLMVYPNGDGFFQQDNAPCHGARIVQEWFQEHEGDITLLRWPPQSPDLNPIEHLWDKVKKAIRQLVPQPSNLTELDSAIHQAWCQIPRITFQHLVESMPRRIATVLKAKGGPMKYWWGGHNNLATHIQIYTTFNGC
uniref:Tc1-like transposase DDE domain-containing protein n=1 Tax=Myotis myotis TaxID=51298 RepID=A0A7J7YDQ8_MYOMY|nr:hypothetical protein mMyoMyo1_011031 [Myotis myotis]